MSDCFCLEASQVGEQKGELGVRGGIFIAGFNLERRLGFWAPWRDWMDGENVVSSQDYGRRWEKVLTCGPCMSVMVRGERGYPFGWGNWASGRFLAWVERNAPTSLFFLFSSFFPFSDFLFVSKYFQNNFKSNQTKTILFSKIQSNLLKQ
jgi:hypothetical protein